MELDDPLKFVARLRPCQRRTAHSRALEFLVHHNGLVRFDDAVGSQVPEGGEEAAGIPSAADLAASDAPAALREVLTLIVRVTHLNVANL